LKEENSIDYDIELYKRRRKRAKLVALLKDLVPLPIGTPSKGQWKK
jgi:hypothetical protein